MEMQILRLALTAPKPDRNQATPGSPSDCCARYWYGCCRSSSSPTDYNHPYRRRQRETMSLDTLLEAARYLELQELEEQQQRQQALVPIVPAAPPHHHHPQQQQSAPPPPPPSQSQPVTVIKPKQEQPIVAVTVQQQQQQTRVIQNSFDIINPLVIDEGGEQKRKQPPLVFRSGTREVHNKLEKHRRAHLKECFDSLKKQLPAQADEKKTSNLSILHSALRYIQSLKRKERELEHEMERLAREKIAAQQRLAVLKKEIAAQYDNIDFGALLPEQLPVAEPKPVQQQHHHLVHHHQQPQPETVPSSIIDRVSILPNNNHKHLQPQQVTTVAATTMTTTAVLPNGIKENNLIASQPQPQQQQQQQVQTTALSVVPMAGYPVSQGLVLHKVALVPKGIAELPLAAVSSPVAHFITAPAQQLNGKVLPVVNAQYVVKPVVVVSSPPSVAPRPS